MNTHLLLLAAASLFLLAPVSQMNGLENSSTVTVNKPDKIKNDAEITDAIKKAILADNELAMYISHVNVETENGVVTLSGEVDKSLVKSNIEAKAKAVLGVSKVVNNIEVKSS